MKNITIAKKMYICATNYFDACKKLKNNLINDVNPSIIYPLLYLERHTLELVLKSIIFLSVKPQIVEKNLIIYYGNGETFNLSLTHSLLILINKYIEINTVDTILPIFDENSISDIQKQLAKFEKIDSKSDFYRYPITKSGKQPRLKIWNKYDIDSPIRLNFKSTHLMYNENNELVYVLKNVDLQSLKYLNILYDICYYFFSQLSIMIK